MPVNREKLPIVVRIVEAVADARGEASDTVDPLSTCFDVESLEKFIDSTNVPTRIAIELEDCTIVIDSEGEVSVSPESFP